MQDIAQFIDHTLLKPEASSLQIKKLCQEANEYGFKSVCINPSNILEARKHIDPSKSLICTVIGFPLGAMTTETKVFETKDAIEKGADEIDMVLNIGRLKEGNLEYIEQDIAAVVKAANGKVVKVIFETCLLNEKEIRLAAKASISAGASFIKTSTGFSSEGANPEVVSIMIDEAQGKCEVKASGGVRSLEDARKYLEMGVKRLGTSSGVAIMEGEKNITTSY
ncbi:deoxyribose-phosphate aldolase [Halobacteriovorax sp. DA5]|uniref:deoxyribose-phosphate aldolase n=1 Tax=Halobacteriovorax sp. DA5 TaxID=2067553 RepID=UPI000CD118E3|nr:deoxyribose-phosphate aldolase [Halobacteriovorax sp. DA5]POB15349.1 deoxyribose-phosphate aldolase [Halobacteriovorax sp. DA5]